MTQWKTIFCSLLAALFSANLATAADDPGVCNFVVDFKLTAYVQTGTDVNDPPGSDTYKHTVAKIKITTSDLIGRIAQASVLPTPPDGTRLAVYTSGTFEGSPCLIDLNGTPIAGFAPISSAILAFDGTGDVKEGSYVDSVTGSEKEKYWELFEMEMIVDPTNDMALVGPISGQYKENYMTGAISDSVKGAMNGTGQTAGNFTFFSGKVSGKLLP